MKPLALSLAAIACCAATAASSPVAALAGRYGQHFRNSAIDGQTGWVDDVLEIVPVDADHAYLKVALHFFNGHECDLHGVAEARGDRLDYRGRPSAFADDGCHMSVYRAGNVIRLDDDGGTCQSTCGSRGGYRQAALPWKSRRPIRYMPLLTGSNDYRDALAQWRARHPENP